MPQGAPHPGGKCREICHGGFTGFFGCNQFDWGGQPGPVYACWRCSPCCGSPCNIKDGFCCLVHWLICPPCSAAKLYSSSGGDNCDCCPHTICMFLALPCACWFTRYNLRTRHGTPGNLMGDLVCMLLCQPCASLQMLRAAKIGEWKLTNTHPKPISGGGCCNLMV